MQRDGHLDIPGPFGVKRRVLCLPRWKWVASGELDEIENLHGRVAHLGIIRCPDEGAYDNGFEWAPWFKANAPVVLRVFRDFLDRVAENDMRRREMFNQPEPYFDLAVVIEGLLSDEPGA